MSITEARHAQIKTSKIPGKGKFSAQSKYFLSARFYVFMLLPYICKF